MTLDFLDAELEDENKEEVGRPRGSFWGTGWLPADLQLQRALGPASLPWGAPCPAGPGTAPVGPRRGRELGHCPLGASMMRDPQAAHPSPLHSAGPQCHPAGVSACWPVAGLCGPQLPPPCPQIRRSMIDGNDGQRFIKTLIKSLDEVTLQGKGVTAETRAVLSAQPQREGVRGCVRHRARSQGPMSRCR